MPIERKKLDALLSQVCENIGGDWVLLGGALALLSFDDTRMTEDIDLFARDQAKAPEKLRKLFAEGRSLGLNEEQLNSAASFFFGEIPSWQEELVLLRSEKNGRIWRPTLTALAYMKLKRGSRIDLQDIRNATEAFGKEEFDFKKFRKWSSEALLLNFIKHRSTLGL